MSPPTIRPAAQPKPSRARRAEGSVTERGGADRWCQARSQGAMKPGSVLFHAPSSVFQSPGGGENQLVQTGRQLEALGLPIRLFNPWADRLEAARLLHLFGMSREGLELARVARARGVRVVLSPICWFEPRAIAALADGYAKKAWDLAKWGVKAAAPWWPSWRRALLHQVDAILPNSRAEGQQLVRLFDADPRRIHIVPNGVSPRFCGTTAELFRRLQGDAQAEFVLFVGRVEPRKNVLGLIRAVGSLGLPLVVIGEPPTGHEEYAARCRSVGGMNVRWLGAVDHEADLLASAYAAARVFALPSWFETPGLAALEAAVAGAAVVVTPFGCTREYFGDRVEYARPDRPKTLRQAIARAWLRGADPGLAAELTARYLWSSVARRTWEVYDQVIG